MLIVLGLVAAWPLLRTIWLGFTDANLLRLDQAKWTGFDNFAGEYGLFHDKVWWHAVKNTLWFTFFSVSIETVLGMVIALVLTRAFPGRGLVRAAVLIRGRSRRWCPRRCGAGCSTTSSASSRTLA